MSRLVLKQEEEHRIWRLMAEIAGNVIRENPERYAADRKSCSDLWLDLMEAAVENVPRGPELLIMARSISGERPELGIG